jgi:hypothetical protein
VRERGVTATVVLTENPVQQELRWRADVTGPGMTRGMGVVPLGAVLRRALASGDLAVGLCTAAGCTRQWLTGSVAR